MAGYILRGPLCVGKDSHSYAPVQGESETWRWEGGRGKGEVGGGTRVCLLHVHVPTLAVINCMCFLLDVFV